MSETTKQSPSSFLTVIGLVFGLLLMFWLVGGLENGEGGIGTQRAQERKSALEEVRQTAAEKLSSYAVLSGEKGVYQVPIERAMEMIVEEWENPEEGREKMLARSEKAFFVPPPAAAPEQPSQYE